MSEEKSKIIIKSDGLYRDDIKLKLEFGNLEQIEALRNHEKKLIQYKEGIKPMVSYKVEASAFFSCICGVNMSLEDVDADNEDDVDCFEGSKIKCRKCDRTYEFVTIKSKVKMSNGKYYFNTDGLRVNLIS